jgi:hypothetical protein
MDSRWKNRESLMMYRKIYTFLQGSDNQVVIQSARAAGIDRVIMPYVTPGFILNTVRYKDSRRDLYRPKYVIKNGLKEFHFDFPKSKFKSERNDLVPLESLIEPVERKFRERADALIAGIGEIVHDERFN